MPLIRPDTPEATSETPGRLDAIDRLASEDPRDRREAALILSGDAGAARALADALLREQDQPARQALLAALIAVDDPVVVTTFTDMLRTDNATHRSEAVTALQQRPAVSADVIAGLLDETDADLRIMAVDLIRMLPDSDAPSWLRRLLATETHPNVVGVAVDRLSEIGGPDDLAALRDVKTRFADDPYLGFVTDMVIERILTLEREAAE